MNQINSPTDIKSGSNVVFKKLKQMFSIENISNVYKNYQNKNKNSAYNQIKDLFQEKNLVNKSEYKVVQHPLSILREKKNSFSEKILSDDITKTSEEIKEIENKIIQSRQYLESAIVSSPILHNITTTPSYTSSKYGQLGLLGCITIVRSASW